MTKTILVSLAVLTLSTSAALAAHRIHHHRAMMNAYGAMEAPPPPGAWMGMGGASSSDRDMYFRNLRDSGYNPKNDFNASGTVATQ
jgi:hypothetical protein